MELSHQLVVAFSKSFGLFYLLAMTLGALVYALWPANRDRFDHSARSIIDDEDAPWG